MKLEYEINPEHWPVVQRFVDEQTPAEAIQDHDGDETVPTQSAVADADDEDTSPHERITEDMAELQRSLVAAGVDFERDYIDFGDQWGRALFVDQWPDVARNGFLQPLFADSGRQVDVTTHVRYRDQDTVEDDLDHKLSDLKADEEHQRKRGSSIHQRVGDLKAELQEIYNTHLDGVPALDTSMYLTVRGPTKRQVREDTQALRNDLAKNPTNMKAVTARRVQKQALQSASPVAKDYLNKNRMMMSKAVASMFFFGNSTFIEPEGSVRGFHAMNGEPVILDRFARETGYNWLVVGDVGSGKSVFSKTSNLRDMLNEQDSIFIMMDPLEGFAGVNEALNGERIVVGGSQGLNPLKINPTPSDVLRRTQGLDPYASKIEDVDSFFENYFALRNASDLFAKYRDTYDTIKQETYSQARITHIPYTHDRPSPTIRPVADDDGDDDDVDDRDDRANMLDVAIEIAESPGEYADTPREEEHIRDGAVWFKRQLEPFKPGGKYANLGGTTDIDVADHDVVYLDLQQMEGRKSIGLMIQLLISAVHERAKTADRKILFSIDESRYLTKNTANLQSLEQAVRHSRHFDLSIQFITQTIDEFFQRPEAKAIAENCSVKALFRTEGMDAQFGSMFDMNENEQQFVQKATAGSDAAGYSECLFGIADDKGGGEATDWYPMHVQLSDGEMAVVDFDADEQSYAELPGMTPEMAAEREAEIEASYEGIYTDPNAAADGGEDR